MEPQSALSTWQWLSILAFLTVNGATVFVLYNKTKVAQERRHAHNARRMDWQLSIMNQLVERMGMDRIDCPFQQDDY